MLLGFCPCIYPQSFPVSPGSPGSPEVRVGNAIGSARLSSPFHGNSDQKKYVTTRWIFRISNLGGTPSELHRFVVKNV